MQPKYSLPGPACGAAGAVRGSGRAWLEGRERYKVRQASSAVSERDCPRPEARFLW